MTPTTSRVAKVISPEAAIDMLVESAKIAPSTSINNGLTGERLITRNLVGERCRNQGSLQDRDATA